MNPMLSTEKTVKALTSPLLCASRLCSMENIGSRRNHPSDPSPTWGFFGRHANSAQKFDFLGWITGSGRPGGSFGASVWGPSGLRWRWKLACGVDWVPASRTVIVQGKGFLFGVAAAGSGNPCAVESSWKIPESPMCAGSRGAELR